MACYSLYSEHLLIGKSILTLPEPRTTSYGLESIKYEALKHWNSLSDSKNDVAKRIQEGHKETRTLRVLITFNYFR